MIKAFLHEKIRRVELITSWGRQGCVVEMTDPQIPIVSLGTVEGRCSLLLYHEDRTVYTVDFEVFQRGKKLDPEVKTAWVTIQEVDDEKLEESGTSGETEREETESDEVAMDDPVL